MPLPRSFIGIFLTFLTIIFAVASGLMVKKIGDQAALVTVLMYRFLLSTPLIALMAFLTRGRQFLQINARRTLMIRVVFGCITMACWFISIRLLPLGQATALLQSSVIFVTLLSPFLLGEVIGIWRWSAVVAGMFGIVLLTNPFDGGFSGNVIYGVAGAVSGAGLSILLRRLGKVDHPASVAVWYNGTGAILLTSLAFALPGNNLSVSEPVMVDLLILGVVAAALQLSITSAYKFSEAVVIASMRYLQIPAAGLVAYLVFAEVMTLTEIAGGVVVIASCLVIGWREMVRSRRLAAADSIDA